MEKRLLDINEVCEYTGWCKTKVREIVKRDDSKFTIKLGNKYFVDKKKFDNYLDNCIKYHIPV